MSDTPTEKAPTADTSTSMEETEESPFNLQAFDPKPAQETKEKKIKVEDDVEEKEKPWEIGTPLPSDYQWGVKPKYFTDETVPFSPPCKEISGIENARILSTASNGAFFSLPYTTDQKGKHYVPAPGVPMENEITPALNSWVLNHLPHTTTHQIDWKKFLPSNLKDASFEEVKAWLDEDPDRKGEIQLMALTEEKKVRSEIEAAISEAYAAQRVEELKKSRKKEVVVEQKKQLVIKKEDDMGDHEVINPFTNGGGRQTVKQIRSGYSHGNKRRSKRDTTS